MSKTMLEALTAEMLGDVGKLHDQIEALPGKLDEVIRPTLKRAEESLPYLLDSKRKEIEEAAARLLTASDRLEKERQALAGALQREVDHQLRQRVEDYTNQVRAATQQTITETVHAEMGRAVQAIETATRGLDRARQEIRYSQMHFMLWLVVASGLGGLVALALYIALFDGYT